MKHSLILVFFTALCIDVAACLNLYVENEHGKSGIHDSEPPYVIYISPSSDLESLKLYEKWVREGKGADQYRYISDYAVRLIKLGHHAEALPILQRLGREKPGEYTILSNLATVYELNGKPDSALKYMRRSLAINPGSHEKSEWFHVRILEAVMANRAQGTNFSSINILQLERETNARIGYEITHQLNERVPLTSAPNPLLSKVLEESADFYKKEISIDWSIKLYAMAAAFTPDAATQRMLWHKIKTARAKVVELNSKSRKAARESKLRRDLLSKGWEKMVLDDVAKWQKHRAHYEKGVVVVDSKTLWKE